MKRIRGQWQRSFRSVRLLSELRKILKVQLVCNDPGSVDGVIAPGRSAELFPAEALKWVSADVHDQLSESIGMDGSAD